MAEYKYSTQIEANCAKAVGVGLPISAKASIEICTHIRGRSVKRAKTILGNVVAEKEAIPYRRFNGDVGHKPGIGPGRYPVKAAQHILDMIKSAEANARFKGLNESALIIKHISAQKGAGSWHYGRQRRRKQKNTHIEIVVQEGKEEKKTEVKKKEVIKPKAVAKPTAPAKTEAKVPEKVETKEPVKTETKEITKPVEKEVAKPVEKEMAKVEPKEVVKEVVKEEKKPEESKKKEEKPEKKKEEPKEENKQ